jgi:hypothetical protein
MVWLISQWIAQGCQDAWRRLVTALGLLMVLRVVMVVLLMVL